MGCLRTATTSGAAPPPDKPVGASQKQGGKPVQSSPPRLGQWGPGFPRLRHRRATGWAVGQQDAHALSTCPYLRKLLALPTQGCPPTTSQEVWTNACALLSTAKIL